MNSEEIKARAERYNKIEKEADSLGRIIGVRRLKPSEEMRITGMTGDLDGFEQSVGEDGNTVRFAKRAPFLVAAMVREIDGIPFTLPKARGELDAVYDRLDREGIEAAMKAYIRLEGVDKPETPFPYNPNDPNSSPAQMPVIDEAKNS